MQANDARALAPVQCCLLSPSRSAKACRPPGGDPPAQRSSHICNGETSDTQAFKRAIDMTDDELAAIVGRATLTLENQILSLLFFCLNMYTIRGRS